MELKAKRNFKVNLMQIPGALKWMNEICKHQHDFRSAYIHLKMFKHWKDGLCEKGAFIVIHIN